MKDYSKKLGNSFEKIQDKLNVLGQCMPIGEGQEAAFVNWCQNVWIVLYEELVRSHKDLEPYREDADSMSAAIEEFCKSLKSYNPEKGSLKAYASGAISKNFIIHQNTERLVQKTGNLLSEDSLKKKNTLRRRLEKSLEQAFPDEKEQQLKAFDSSHYPSVAPLTMQSEDGEFDIPLPAKDSNSEEQLLLQSTVTDLVTQLVIFERTRNKRKNSVPDGFYTLWYTEKLTRIVQNGFFPDDEQDAFHAMDKEYLDFFLEKICRDFKSLSSCLLRKASEVFPEETGDDRLHWSNKNWLPAKVPITFLLPEIVNNSTISRSRSSYEGILLEILKN